MFILMQSVWDSGIFQEAIASANIDLTSTGMIMGVSVLLSQVLSNVPLVALYLPCSSRRGRPPRGCGTGGGEYHRRQPHHPRRGQQCDYHPERGKERRRDAHLPGVRENRRALALLNLAVYWLFLLIFLSGCHRLAVSQIVTTVPALLKKKLSLNSWPDAGGGQVRAVAQPQPGDAHLPQGGDRLPQTLFGDAHEVRAADNGVYFVYPRQLPDRYKVLTMPRWAQPEITTRPASVLSPWPGRRGAHRAAGPISPGRTARRRFARSRSPRDLPGSDDAVADADGFPDRVKRAPRLPVPPAGKECRCAARPGFCAGSIWSARCRVADDFYLPSDPPQYLAQAPVWS